MCTGSLVANTTSFNKRMGWTGSTLDREAAADGIRLTYLYTTAQLPRQSGVSSLMPLAITAGGGANRHPINESTQCTVPGQELAAGDFFVVLDSYY